MLKFSDTGAYLKTRRQIIEESKVEPVSKDKKESRSFRF